MQQSIAVLKGSVDNHMFEWSKPALLAAKLELSTLCTKVSPCGSISIKKKATMKTSNRNCHYCCQVSNRNAQSPPCSGCCPAAESEELRREIVDGQTSVARSSVGAQTFPGEPRPSSLLVSNRRSTCEVVLGLEWSLSAPQSYQLNL